MKRLLLAAALGIVAIVPASAGTTLQLQLQRWVTVNSTTVKVQVSLRNATMKSFAKVIWDCDFFDEDHHLIGQWPLVFTVVPWGAVTIDTQYVVANVPGTTFGSASCRLAYAEEKTFKNEKLYRASPQQMNIGNGDPASRQWFSFDKPIQGRASVITEAEEAKLEAEHH